MRTSFLLGVLALALCISAASLVAAHRGPPHALTKVRLDNMVSQPSGGMITIDAPVLNGTGSWVTVSWSNIGSPWPGNNDWIGVWSPKPTDYTKTTPVKYKYVISDATGAGSSEFWLLNMRDSYMVAYFTGGFDTPVLLAESQPVDFSNYHVPMQIHLAYTSDPTEMRVNWVTKLNSFPSVYWGLEATVLNQSNMHVTTTTYKASDLCGHPATTIGWRDPGYLHTAVMTNLQPNTQYFYRLGEEAAHASSAVYSFYSAPVQSPDSDLDFFIFGDLGQVEVDGSNEASMMDGSIFTTVALQQDLEDGSLQTNLSAVAFLIGDISYARGYATLWEQYFYQMSNLTTVLPWMTTDGNHERDFPNSGSLWNGSDSGGECGIPYENRFTMPTSAIDNTWYSLDYGSIHWIVLSTEHRFDSSSKQYQWLINDFQSVNRSITPWLVVTGHRPMYVDSTDNSTHGGGDQSTASLLRKWLEPLLQQYQVDVAFWGHHHSYQRTCSVYQGECVSQGGITHIVTGASGGGFSANFEPELPSYMAYAEDDIHGYTRAHVRGNTMRLDFVRSIDRVVLDSVTLQSQFPVESHRTHVPVASDSIYSHVDITED